MCTDSAVDSKGSAGAPEFRSNKAWSERFDNAAHAIRELNKRFHDRLTLDNPRFVERYAKFELHILVRFGVSGIDEKFIARFERETNIGGADEQLGESEPLRESGLGHWSESRENVHALKHRPDWDNQAVLVDVVEAMEGPEIGALSSIVRFESADRIDRVLPHAMYFSWKSGFEFFGSLGDQKTCLVPVAPATRTDEIELLGQMVQRTAQVVKNVTGDDSDVGWKRISPRDIIDQLSGRWIALSGDFVRIGIKEVTNNRLKVTDMFVGPFNF